MSKQMKKPFIEVDLESFRLPEYITKPLIGFEFPTNKETGEVFPDCCTFHKSVSEGAELWFAKFPNCCKEHEVLPSKKWFAKSNYSETVKKIVNQLAFTEHQIQERIENEDWYSDITEYIEYNVFSFGHPAIGLHLYFGNLKQSLQKSNRVMPEGRRRKLIEFIDQYYNVGTKEVKEGKATDLNILYVTYRDWLKIFPFEISFLAHLRPQLENQLPILSEPPKVNRYSGIAKARMHTKASLVECLMNTTNSILKELNTYSLYTKGLLSEPQKVQLELVVSERKMKLEHGYINNSKDEETRYRKILKAWFADEKKFVEEITTLLKLKVEETGPEKRLKSIWLAEPKIAVSGFLELGIELGIWNEQYHLITQKASIYGTGKTLLGSLAIALRGHAISEHTDYKEIGKVFCQVFNINLNESTKEPYKAFSSGNVGIIAELKRAFRIK